MGRSLLEQFYRGSDMSIDPLSNGVANEAASGSSIDIENISDQDLGTDSAYDALNAYFSDLFNRRIEVDGGILLSSGANLYKKYEKHIDFSTMLNDLVRNSRKSGDMRSTDDIIVGSDSIMKFAYDKASEGYSSYNKVLKYSSKNPDAIFIAMENDEDQEIDHGDADVSYSDETTDKYGYKR